MSPSWLPVGAGDGAGEDDAEAAAVGEGLDPVVEVSVALGVGRGVLMRVRAAVPTCAVVERAACTTVAAARGAAEAALWTR